MSSYVRSMREALEADLWPFQGLVGDPEVSRRHAAIAKVLRRIPAGDYEKLNERAATFHWFIPDAETGAAVYSFSVTHGDDEETRHAPGPTPIRLRRALHARVLYLSPMLEQRAWPTRSTPVRCGDGHA